MSIEINDNLTENEALTVDENSAAEIEDSEIENAESIERQKSISVEQRELTTEKVGFDNKTETEEKDRNTEKKSQVVTESERAEIMSDLEKEMSKKKSDLLRELEGKRLDFEKERQKALDDLSAELATLRNETRIEIDKYRRNQESALKKDREAFEKELIDLRQKTNEKIESDKETALNNLDVEIKLRTEDLTRNENALKVDQDRMKKAEEQIEKKEKELEEREEKLTDSEREYERKKRRLDREKSRIDEDENNLTEVVNQKIADTIKNYREKIEVKDEELDNLRNQLSSALKEIEQFKSFKEAYGDDPLVIKQLIKNLENERIDLRNKLSDSADKEELARISEEYKNAKEDVDKLSAENLKMKDDQEKSALREADFRILDSKYKSLQATCESLENQLEYKNQELIRLSSPEAKVADREARIAAIEAGVLGEQDLRGAGEGKDSRYNTKEEIAWLEDILNNCEQYGIKFNKRILYAFHTALKINEWSTITILAGVSGTGKSELPRLYSEFGGLNFCSVAVQPDWDSQESMLGFFNSIDNQFEPEELLKFLVQCTTDSRYSDYMSIVLLDEMNLAHVEHYFAEFLSKLELRRGLLKTQLPEIEVKLGAGVKPYGLKLSRTILWTGTMNQDETTKSLSDKVLDRGIVINFPRPRQLESRSEMKLLTRFIGNDRPKMHKDTWAQWTSHKIEFSEEQMKEIDKYRMIVEEINDALEEVGRAIGHRVWQSIEYYIANYPTVREAMKYQSKQNDKGKIVLVPTNRELTEDLRKAMRIAFEDQIVQKIMPKLRGIETRDKRGKSSLDKIEDLLVAHDFDSLQEDFQIAREQGYGQFIWNSAKYLDKQNVDEKVLQNS